MVPKPLLLIFHIIILISEFFSKKIALQIFSLKIHISFFGKKQFLVYAAFLKPANMFQTCSFFKMV